MIFRLNKKFYDIETAKEAAGDFSKICRCRIFDYQNDDIVIELTPKGKLERKKDGSLPLKEEFCNYVLGLMKNKTLV